jgi:hypothetical protein
VTEADFAREWTAFGGASLALMGAALAFGARGYVDDHLAWQREWSRAVGASEPVADAGRKGLLLFVFRLIGVAGVLAGAGVMLAAASGRILASRAAPSDARIMGASLIVLGFGCALIKLNRDARRPSRFTESDPLAAAPAPGGDALAAETAVWLLCALWTGFGVWLFWEATR